MITAGKSKMSLVIESIKESELNLDDAIAHAERYSKKVKKVVDKTKKICHNSSRKI